MRPPDRLPVDPGGYGSDAGYLNVGSLRKVFDLQEWQSEHDTIHAGTTALGGTYSNTGSGRPRSGETSHVCGIEIGKLGFIVCQVSRNADDWENKRTMVSDSIPSVSIHQGHLPSSRERPML
jgi:hypothetical protein